MARIATPTGYPRQSPSGNREGDFDNIDLVQAFLRARAQGVVPGAHLVKAWDRFFPACDSLIRRHVYRHRMRDAERQDACQEVWCAIITHIRQYDRRRGPFHCWLRGVICNVIVHQERANGRFRHTALDDERIIADRNCNPLDLCEMAETWEYVAAAMAELRTLLSEINYRIIHDHWFEESSFTEIALLLGLTTTQVRDRRAMVKLREILSRGSHRDERKGGDSD